MVGREGEIRTYGTFYHTHTFRSLRPAKDGNGGSTAIHSTVAKGGNSLETQRAARRSAQRQGLIDLLADCGGNVAEMARRLDLTRGAVVYRLQKHGLMV